MISKFSKLSFIALLAFIFATMTAAFAVPLKHDKHEINLAKLIEERCRAETVSILSFPDGFQSQTGFSYCEAAFALNPKEHAHANYLYYRANNILKFGTSKKVVRSINQFLMPVSDPYDESLKNLKIRAENSDAWALLELSRLAYTDEIRMDISKLPPLGSPELMRLLFLETSKFTEQVHNWKIFEKHLDVYLENVWQLSSKYTYYAASKLLAVLDEFDTDEDFLASTFDIPEHLCARILAALTFVDATAVDQDFVWLLRLRVWSPREMYSSRYLGYEKSFIGQLPRGAEFDYLYTLMDIENALSRVRYIQNTPTPEKIERINYYENKFPKFRARFLKYFPKTLKSGILDVDSTEISDRFLDILKNSAEDKGKEYFAELLFADIRMIAAFPHLKKKNNQEYLQLINPKNDYVKSVYSKPRDPLEAYNLAYTVGSEFKNQAMDLNKLLAKADAFSKRSCDPEFDLICRKKWADADVSIERVVGISGGCEIKRKFKSLVKKQALTGAIDYRLFYFCSFKQVANLFGKSVNELRMDLPKLLYSSGSTSYTNLLYSEPMVVHGGLIAEKIYTNLPNKKWLPTPSYLRELTRSSYPYAWAFTSAISNGPIPEVPDSGPFGPYVNYASLADIYTITGNYERGLSAQIRALNQNIYLANKYPDDFLSTVLDSFIKTKHLLRLTNIPEPIVRSFIKEKFSEVLHDVDLIKIPDQPLGIFKSVSGETIKTQAMGYLELLGSEDFTFSANEFDVETAFDFVRAALTEQNFHQDSCTNQKILKALYEPKDEQSHYNNLGSAVWFSSDAMGHEFLGFWHECAKTYLNQLHEDGNIEEVKRLYNRYISMNVPDYLKSNFNFSEPRSIKTFAFWTRAARLSGSVNGLIMSVTAADHIYRQLSYSFVYNDSRSLRSNQKYLEQIVVEASFAISEMSDDPKLDKFALEYVKDKIESLRRSSKVILSSDQKRQRYIGLNQINGDPQFVELNDALTNDFRFWPEVGQGAGIWLKKKPDGKVRIANILRDGPAFGLGFEKDDELVAYNGIRVQETDTVSSLIKWYVDQKPETLTLTVAKADGTEVSGSIKNTNNWFEKGLENQLRKELFLSANRETENANSPISYIQKIAKKGELEKLKLPFFPYEAEAHLSWSQKNAELKLPIYSLSYSKGSAVLDVIEPTGKTYSKLVRLDWREIEQLTERLISGEELRESEVDKACKIFQNLSDAANVAETEGIVFVPSVNLFPIPADILFGSYCNSKLTAIIQASDITGAINFSRYQSEVKIPDSFVGVGNPTIGPEKPDNIFASLFRGEGAERTFEGLAQNFLPLPDAEAEILETARGFNSKNVYLSAEASILSGLKKATEISNNGRNVAITIATHGVPLSVKDGIYMPSLLSVENGQKKLISNSMIESSSMPNSTVVLSACDTAAGLAETKDLMFTGFVESFANAGSELMIASLWPVHSKSSTLVSTTFFKSWRKSGLMAAISSAKNSVKKRVRTLPFVYLIP